MIAYDIDGIFLSDFTDVNDKVLEVRHKNAVPIFIPDGEYVLITGRPVQDHGETLSWIKTHFTINPPLEVYLNPSYDFQTGVQWKISVLNDHPEIHLLMESDREQTEKIRKEVIQEVVLFSAFINHFIQKT